MPSLDDFLNKPKGRNWDGWEEMFGNYGCQKCDEDMDTAYFNPNELIIMWVCSQNHESKVELV
jgi:hypothetical protein